MDLADVVQGYFGSLADADAYPGVALIEREGEVLFSGAYGLASRAWNVPSTLETRYDVASVTKLFTAAAVLQQIDAGALAFDTRVVEYLGLTGTALSPEITVMHLLTHTSGIADDADEEAGEEYEDLFRDVPNYRFVDTRDSLVNFVHKPPVFAPGEGCRYNNVAFILAGLCVEQATGAAYRDYVQRNVFERAGMARSGFFRMDHVVPDVAENLEPLPGGGWRRNIYSYPPIGGPDGGAHSTAGDLLTFFHAARDAQLCSPAMTKEWFEPRVFHSERNGRTQRNAIVFEHFYDADGRHRFLQKEGFNVGVSALLRHYSRTGTTVVLLNNTSDGVWTAARHLDTLLAD